MKWGITIFIKKCLIEYRTINIRERWLSWGFTSIRSSTPNCLFLSIQRFHLPLRIFYSMHILYLYDFCAQSFIVLSSNQRIVWIPPHVNAIRDIGPKFKLAEQRGRRRPGLEERADIRTITDCRGKTVLSVADVERSQSCGRPRRKGRAD